MDEQPVNYELINRVYQKEGRLGVLVLFGISEEQYWELMVKWGATQTLLTLKQREEKERSYNYGYAQFHF